MAETKELAGKQQPDKEKDKGEQAAAGGAAAAKKGNPIAFWGIVAAIALAELPIMYFMIRITRPKPPQEATDARKSDSLKTEELTAMGMTTAPIEIITNVAGTDASRFLKVVAVLEYEDPAAEKEKAKGGGEGGHGEGKPKKGRMQTELEARAPKYKSMLIDLMSTKQLTELNDPAERDRMREEFRREVNKTLPPAIGSVTQVYFQEFIIQ